MAEGEVNIDNIIQRLLEGKSCVLKQSTSIGVVDLGLIYLIESQYNQTKLNKS